LAASLPILTFSEIDCNNAPWTNKAINHSWHFQTCLCRNARIELNVMYLCSVFAFAAAYLVKTFHFKTVLKRLPIQGSMLWSQFSVIFSIFSKNGIFLKYQCYDQFFSKFGFVLSQKRQYFRRKCLKSHNIGSRIGIFLVFIYFSISLQMSHSGSPKIYISTDLKAAARKNWEARNKQINKQANK
jgi:hypothetical protein